mgnify:CR=1 FL=1
MGGWGRGPGGVRVGGNGQRSATAARARADIIIFSAEFIDPRRVAGGAVHIGSHITHYPSAAACARLRVLGRRRFNVATA